MATIEELGFRNPVHPGLPIETVTLAELRRRTGSGHRARHYRLGFHQLLLIESGSATITVDFAAQQCRPGTLLWMRPDQVQHGVFPTAIDGRAVLFTEGFLPAVPLLAPLLQEGDDTFRWDLPAADLAAIISVFQQLDQDCSAATEPRGVELARHELVVVLLRLLALPHTAETHPRPAGTGVYPMFRREVERHHRRMRNVEDYAPLINTSVRTINRACRAATGHTAKQIIDRRVVLEAKRLLVHTDQPVAAIGRQLGFAEATNFVKYFVLHVGTTPGRFRTQPGV
ncbi:AraC family transcriptional regulator [Actinoplanes sp. NPDC051861]|uniref:helix-turn-helix transcriptional regulator n=1 Tax=Actinoplanes sp. NPDC051861 TaxID=3155170 RepID=UPI003412BE72